jgi:outer membrane protein assembly factor BamD (BamD/ComL family)
LSVTQPIAEHGTRHPDQGTPDAAPTRVGLRWPAAVALALLCLSWTGCLGDKQNLNADTGPGPDKDGLAKKDKEEESGFDLSNLKAPWHWEMFRPKPPKPPEDSLVLRGDSLEADSSAKYGQAGKELAGAKELFRKGDYDKAAAVFNYLAENKRNPPQLAEEARYYEAESLRLQGKYPKAADTYVKMLNDFPSGAFREQALQHVFDIANYWLDDTRQEMVERREIEENKRWFTTPHFVHWDKTKPLLDEEGRAVEKLEQVRYNDMMGPLADKTLFLLGSVKFFNADYREAEHYFSQLAEMHPNSKLRPQAIELGIIAKNLSTGGPDYDGRKSAEARQLVHTALNNCPELANKREFMERQLVSITLQQADKDYRMAEFYRRTGHPEAAYFYYEIVRRRYPGTKYAERAALEMEGLRAKVEKQGSKVTEPRPGPAPAGPGPVAPGQPLLQPSSTEGRQAGQPEMAPAPRPLSPGIGPAPMLPPVPGVP